MGIRIIAVGKLKERFWKDAVTEYLKRLGGYAKVEVQEVPDKGIEQEAADILRLAGNSHLILLAIEGTPRSSEDLAARIEDLMTHGTSDITFCIGGSDGVTQAVRDRADETVSFGKITLPHNLARVVLVEQLYRAFKIIKHEPYHK